MRQAKACLACRGRRRKCEIVEPGLSCTYCSDRGLPCTRNDFPSKAQAESHEPPSQPPASTLPTRGSDLLDTQSCTLPAQNLCTELVQLYFDFVHDKFHSLFHRPSFIEDMLQGQAPIILLYGIIALSARFSTDSFFSEIDPRERGMPYAKVCEHLLDLHDISLTTIQACVLLGAVAVTEGEPASETVYYSIACRIAQLLDLPNCLAPSRVEQEVNIRVWWTLCMIDVWSSDGVRLPRLLIPQDKVPLPMDEATFLHLTRCHGFDVEVDIEPASSLLAQMVRLNRILQQINNFNFRAANSEIDVQSMIRNVEDLSQQLDNWLEALPNHMRDSRSNLVSYASQGLGRLFVTLYLGYYHYGQLLFYRFLHEDSRTFIPRTRFYANKCKEHAVKLCEILYASNEIPGCDVFYNMVGHVLVISSTVQIHTLLFEGDDDAVKLAKARLEKNFCILTGLRRLWPTLDVCMARLRAFHQACRTSVDTSFCMDKWMLRFLVEFAKPVGDKISHGHDEGNWTLEQIGITPDEIILVQ